MNMNRSWLNNANVVFLIICYLFSSRLCWYNNIGNAFMFTPSFSSFPHSSKNRLTKGMSSPVLTFTKNQASSTIIRKAIISDKNDNDDDDKKSSSSSSWEIKNRPQDVNIADFLDTATFLFLKVLDTIEDAYTHLRRLQAEESYIDTSSTVVDCLEQWNDDTDPRPKLLVIGSGWASHACLKIVDSLDTGYRVLCVSTKNYFLFTPMLASSSVGTIEFRSIVEPIRDANPTVSFIEGSISDIEPTNQTACIILKSSTISSSDDDDNANESSSSSLPSSEKQEQNSNIIDVSYDVCVYACGVQAGGNGNSISKVPGVSSTNCHFLKDVSDALRLRISVGNLLERASRPRLTDNERRNLLHFVVVGGGATGVEYIGELTDFLRDVTSKERKGAYALLSSFTSITLVHGGNEILPQFDKPLRTKAVMTLTDRGVDVRLNTRVAKVESPTLVKVYKKKDDDDSEQQQGEVGSVYKEVEIHCGIIVWAAGTAPVPLTGKLLDKLPLSTRQKSCQGRIPVDPWLRVIGSPSGTLFALGDASMIVSSTSSCDSHDGQPEDDDGDRKEQHQQHQQQEDYILPQTAQVAAQQGAYMARLLNRKYCLSGFTTLPEEENYAKESISTPITAGPRPPIHLAANDGDISSLIRLRGSVEAKPFRFLNLGLLAFLGGGEALSQIQFGGSSGSGSDNGGNGNGNGDGGGYKINEAGSTGFLLWRSVYIVKQVSTRTRVLVLFDWFKCKLFGRDVTRL